MFHNQRSKVSDLGFLYVLWFLSIVQKQILRSIGDTILPQGVCESECCVCVSCNGLELCTVGYTAGKIVVGWTVTLVF